MPLVHVCVCVCDWQRTTVAFDSTNYAIFNLPHAQHWNIFFCFTNISLCFCAILFDFILLVCLFFFLQLTNSWNICYSNDEVFSVTDCDRHEKCKFKALNAQKKFAIIITQLWVCCCWAALYAICCALTQIMSTKWTLHDCFHCEQPGCVVWMLKCAITTQLHTLACNTDIRLLLCVSLMCDGYERQKKKKTQNNNKGQWNLMP